MNARLILGPAALLLATALLMAGPGCQRRPPAEAPRRSAEAPQGDPRPGGTLRVALAGDPAPLNPLLGRRGSDLDLWHCFYPALVRCSPRGARPPAVEGDLARRWSWDPEGSSVRVVLQRNRYWEDTVRVRAQDVKVSYDAYRLMGLLPSRAARDSLLDPGLAGVEALDDSTLLFRFRPGYASWRIWPTLAWPILPAHRLGTLSRPLLETSPLAREPLSAGPLRLVEWRPGHNLRAAANSRAPAGSRPYTRIVSFEPCPGAVSRILRAQLGLADVAIDVAVNRLGFVLGPEPAVRAERAGVLSVEMIAWNVLQPALPPGLRRAIDLSIDRQRLVEVLLSWRGESFGGAAAGVLEPAGPPAGDSSLAVGPIPRHDPIQAGLLLDDLAWIEQDTDGYRRRAGLPLEIELIYERESELHERIATCLEEDLYRVGVRLNPVALESSSFWRRYRLGLYQGALVGFCPPLVPDLHPLWGTGGTWNTGGYSSSAVDSLLAEQARAASPAEVEALSRRIEAIIRRDRPVTFLCYREQVDLVSSRVGGYRGSRDVAESLRGVWLADTLDAEPGQIETAGSDL